MITLSVDSVIAGVYAASALQWAEGDRPALLVKSREGALRRVARDCLATILLPLAPWIEDTDLGAVDFGSGDLVHVTFSPSTVHEGWLLAEIEGRWSAAIMSAATGKPFSLPPLDMSRFFADFYPGALPRLKRG